MYMQKRSAVALHTFCRGSTPAVWPLNETPAPQPLVGSPNSICTFSGQNVQRRQVAFSFSIKNLLREWVRSELTRMAAAVGTVPIVLVSPSMRVLFIKAKQTQLSHTEPDFCCGQGRPTDLS